MRKTEQAAGDKALRLSFRGAMRSFFSGALAKGRHSILLLPA
jgi:hypothetical protein